MAPPRANIKPKLLEWARKKAGFSTEDAAKKIGVKEDRLINWEGNKLQPTIKQLRKAAHVYRVPVSVLYLGEPPATFQPMRDLRRLPGAGMRTYSPGLLREMEFAQQKRELAIELHEDIGEEIDTFELQATPQEDAEIVGQRIRQALGIAYHEQARWRDPRVGFNAWREYVEQLGVLVFQFKNVPSDEVSGFALAENRLPVIAVNRKDVFSRRVFSLMHEFSHLLLRISGTSDLDVDATRPPEDAAIEVFCNKVAAATLLPRDHFLGEDIVQARGAGMSVWSDQEVSELADRYSVSRIAVVRRLLTLGRTSQAFYREKQAQYNAEYDARKKREKERNKGKEFRLNPARDTVLDNGKPYVRLVINNYHQDRITLSEVSGYLGVKIKHLLRIENSIRGL